MSKNACLSLLSAICLWSSTSPLTAAPESAQSYDLVVYGGTSGGITAAIQAAKMGKSVVLIEPGRFLGGLTAGGLGATDIGNKGAIGGLSREFYRRIGQHYSRPEAWKQETAAQYQSARKQPGEAEMWTFEPHVAAEVYHNWLAEHRVPVVLQERLDRRQGVSKHGRSIVKITMESGRVFAGKMFIDATYEGDLMATAGVSYHVGREANATYDETLNGVQPGRKFHQFRVDVDPYRVAGDPKSGLLPGVEPGPPGELGSGDRRVQAYNFRMCLTDVQENQVPFPQPEGYDPLRYEIALRTILAGQWDGLGAPSRMPNRKTDTNNNGAFSSDHIGRNYDYPEADYATREKIFQDHVAYQQGWCYFLANDPRVPANIQQQVRRWGLAKDEFPTTGHWPHQMYVREARRMISDYVMTQHNCQGRQVPEDAVGLAAYTMDSHNVQRYVDAQGHVRNEGDVQVGGFPPYPISYRSIIPPAQQCDNLLVPVCLSASHIAYGSIRMEPVFMVLGQSAATAAALAIDQGSGLQSVDYATLKTRLLADGQVLEWSGPRGPVGLSVAKMGGIVVDDTQAQLRGQWTKGQTVGPFVGDGYLHDEDGDKGQKSARFVPQLPAEGKYEVRLIYSPHANRATQVPIVVHAADGEHQQTINQRQPPAVEGTYQVLGTFPFQAGDKGWVEIQTTGTTGHVIVDAVQFLKRS